MESVLRFMDAMLLFIEAMLIFLHAMLRFVEAALRFMVARPLSMEEIWPIPVAVLTFTRNNAAIFGDSSALSRDKLHFFKTKCHFCR